jgi:hypothetical protein
LAHDATEGHVPTRQRFALPNDVSDYDQIVELARGKVPSLYGDPAV